LPIFPNGVASAVSARNVSRQPLVSSGRTAPGPGSKTTWGQFEQMLSGAGQYSGHASKERGYRESPWIAPTVHTFASALAACPFRMWREGAERKERITDHLLLDLMARPNPHLHLSEYAFKYQTFAFYDFDGEVLWHIGRAEKSRPGGVKRGDPSFITIFRKHEARPILGHDEEFIGWELSIDGKPYFADRDDVIHFPQLDLLNHRAEFNPFTMKRREPRRGRSSLESKRASIGADLSMAHYQQDFFDRGVSAGLVIINKSGIQGGPEEFTDRLRARLSGTNRQPIVLENWDGSVQDLHAAQSDAEFSKGRDATKAELLAGRTPRAVLGDDNATYANGQMQVFNWWETVLNPAGMHFSATLDANLLGDEPDVWCELSTDHVEALQIAKRERVKSAIELAKERVPWDVAGPTVGVEMEQFEGSDTAFGSYTIIPIRDILAGSSKAEIATEPAPGAPKPPDETNAPADDAAPPPDQAPRFFRVVAPDSIRVAASATRMPGPFEFASTHINLAGEIAAKVVALAKSIPDEALAPKGRETDAHVTVKYGIDPAVTAAQVREALANSDSAIEMAARGASMTLGKTAFLALDDCDVVIVDVDSPDLVVLNKIIIDALPVTDTQPEYIPHATLAYVLSGRGAEFAGNDSLEGIVVPFDTICYSDTDGNIEEISLAAAVATRTAPKIVRVRPVISIRTPGDDAAAAIRKIIVSGDKDLQRIAGRAHVKALEEGAKQIGDLLGLSSGKLVGLDDPRVAEFLATRANLITGVNTTTGDQILNSIRLGMSEGDTPEAIAKQIRDVYNLRKTQADLIARQETGSALTGGRYLEMQDAGSEATEWLTSRDDKVRETHSELDGDVVALGDVFKNGCRYPLDPDGPVGEVMGCRCVPMVAKLSGERLLKTEAQRATYWRTAMQLGTRNIEKALASALGRYFNEQRGAVLAELAKRLAA
jgi:SPP1 gp7 family putative phage head morphogenesis protein